MPGFSNYVGIDYSGRDQPTARLSGLRVYNAGAIGQPVETPNPDPPARRWSRRELATWLAEFLVKDRPTIVGIDHAFSFPLAQWPVAAADWECFLQWFCDSWPTDQVTVEDAIRELPPPPEHSYRLTEKWSSSARSIFSRSRYGVFKSTFAGIPWLRWIRACAPKVFFWPYDGRTPPSGTSVVAEVYPAVFNRRYVDDPACPARGDRRDAYSVCHWLADTDRRNLLQEYFNPPLTNAEWRSVRLEGWILGIR